MSKIKPVIRIIAFALVFSVMLYVLSYLAKPDGPDLDNIQGLYSEKDNTVDMVYIGGSAAFVYYAPLRAWDKHGIVSYNYAADTIQPELYKTMIKEVLKTQKPKLIVLDARAFQYRDKENADAQPPGEVSYRNVLTGMRFSANKVDFINNYVEKQLGDKKLSYYFDLVKYHDNIVNCNSNNFKMLIGKYVSPYNGFYFVPKVEKIEKHNFKTSEKKPLSRDTQAIFDDLIEYLKSTEVNCLFVVSPYAEKKEHKMTFNYVSEKVEDSGYKFVDFNEYTDQMGLDFDTDLYNENHVNIYGAEKYTDFFAGYLKDNNYSLPDKKNDSNYLYMNDRTCAWNKAVEAAKATINKIIEERKNEK